MNFYIFESMSTAETKLNLVQMIIESEDKTFVTKVLAYARSLKTHKEDWADDLPGALLEELDLAIQEADNGKDVGVPNAEILLKYQKKYPHLNL